MRQLENRPLSHCRILGLSITPLGIGLKSLTPRIAANFAYDVRSRLTQVTDALNGVTAYWYDNNGNRTSVTNARNYTTSKQVWDFSRNAKHC
ncbi:MAG: RHS repeat protein [Clostridia bacterium]|nr:RHS repeat protein [Clostridia bacterium]